jgi:methionine synthase / methylenetetrahydrofolate reductase(NADPH)
MAGSRFLQTLQDRVVLGSGAMGTEFLRRSRQSGHPLDELNLTRPHLVLGLYREYVEAGAEVIKTNTFLANRLRLAKAGLEDKVGEINLAGARLAREAAPNGFVAGAVGPLSDLHASAVEKSEAFLEQCRSLAAGGSDLLLLESFRRKEDLALAVAAARETGLPVVSQLAALEEKDLDGLVPADVMGVNCITGDQAVAAVKRLQGMTDRPRSAWPSGGLPGKEILPGEFADSIRALVAAGARLVGGCCGTGPEHIRAAALLGGVR